MLNKIFNFFRTLIYGKKEITINTDKGCPCCAYEKCVCDEDSQTLEDAGYFCAICDRTIDRCDCIDSRYN